MSLFIAPVAPVVRESPLLGLPGWVLWLCVGIVVVAASVIIVRLMLLRKRARPEYPAARASLPRSVSARGEEPFVSASTAPMNATTPRLGLPLPPAIPAQPLPPPVALDRDGALRWMR